REDDVLFAPGIGLAELVTQRVLVLAQEHPVVEVVLSQLLAVDLDDVVRLASEAGRRVVHAAGGDRLRLLVGADANLALVVTDRALRLSIRSMMSAWAACSFSRAALFVSSSSPVLERMTENRSTLSSTNCTISGSDSSYQAA